MKGLRSGENTRLPPNLRGLRSNYDVDAICGLSWLSWLLVLLLAPRFFSGYSGFPASTQKSTLPNSNLIWTNAPTGLNSYVFGG